MRSAAVLLLVTEVSHSGCKNKNNISDSSHQEPYHELCQANLFLQLIHFRLLKIGADRQILLSRLTMTNAKENRPGKEQTASSSWLGLSVTAFGAARVLVAQLFPRHQHQAIS